MKKSAIFTLLISFVVLFTYGQTKKLICSVYFKTDKFLLSDHEKNTLDTLIYFLTDKDIERVVIKGNTDSDADSIYNIELSEKRSASVKNYLVENSIEPPLFKVFNLGEDKPIANNDVDEGKQKNRRVDIYAFYKEKKIIEEKPVKAIKTETDPCKRDTVITLPQGSRYAISICDYYKFKDCLKIKEYIDAESILNSDFTTTTTRNEQLATGGMFDIQLCDDKPLQHPIIFRVPVSRYGLIQIDSVCGVEVNYKKMLLYTSDKHGNWSGSKRISIVKSNDSLFYEFAISRNGKFNLDYKYNERNLTNIKCSIKSKRKVRLIKARLFTSSPRSVYQEYAINRDHKIKFLLPSCPSNNCECLLLKAYGINEAGDTLVTSGCINRYKHRLLFGKCKFERRRIGGYIFGVIPVRKKGIYRKYIIKASDWMIKTKKIIREPFSR
ncbi:MAG: OmpA family protein [Bacteroidales bacterium]